MRVSLAWLAILVLALSVAAPVLEAFDAECAVECATGAELDCGSSDCCSCCPVARFVTPHASPTPRLLVPCAGPVDVDRTGPPDAEPRGILHVPKVLAS